MARRLPCTSDGSSWAAVAVVAAAGSAIVSLGVLQPDFLASSTQAAVATTTGADERFKAAWSVFE